MCFDRSFADQKMEPIALELPRIVGRMRTLETLHKEAALFRYVLDPKNIVM